MKDISLAVSVIDIIEKNLDARRLVKKVLLKVKKLDYNETFKEIFIKRYFLGVSTEILSKQYNKSKHNISRAMCLIKSKLKKEFTEEELNVLL